MLSKEKRDSSLRSILWNYVQNDKGAGMELRSAWPEIYFFIMYA